MTAGTAATSCFTCPRCGCTSYNPFDVLEQYCGNCHQWFNEYGPHHYDRDGKPISIARWSNLYSNYSYVQVAETCREKTRVSTVWLGLDYSFGFGPPLIFETAVLERGKMVAIADRYATLTDAIRGHKSMVAQITRLTPFSNPRPLSQPGRVVSRKYHARKTRR